MYSVQSPPVGNTSAASISTDVIPAGYTAIYTAEDLNNMRNNLSGKYILMNDIDLSSIDNWNPIGDYGTSNSDFSKAFQGTLDGNGHIIKNLKINRTTEDQVGLLGFTANATIKNLGIEDVDVKGKDGVGALIGTSSYNTNISDCYSSGNITGHNFAGGLVGSFCHSKLANSYSSAAVNSSSQSGALLGNCYDSEVTKSYSTGSVTGIASNIGGLVGEFGDSDISDCYSTANVTGQNGYIGGFIGLIYGTNNINNGYFSGDVKCTGSGKTGVLVGCISNSSKTTLNNLLGDKKEFNYNNIGEATKAYNGAMIVSHEEFTSYETWDKTIKSDAWEMSYSIPPVLKGVRGQEINWYFKESSNEFRLQVGAGSDPATNALFVDTGLDLGAINIDLSTVNGCLNASNCAKAALDIVAKKTADIGVSQSRLETISNVNTTKIENLTAAYATVTEADVAEETMNFTKSQIFASTAASLITQTQAFQANLLLRMINSLG